jgi:putative ABC transport system permease protein
MIKNYLRITLRNMGRHKGFTFINVIGLATGMAAFVLIVLFIQHERSFDAHNEHRDDVYRMTLDAAVAGQEILTTSSPAVMAGQFLADFPEVVAATRIDQFSGENLFSVGDNSWYETGFFQADSSFFDLFTVTFLEGNPVTALNRPGTIVISESVAEKAFPNGNALGKTLRHDNRVDYEITGVYQDFPVTSHFRPSLIGSFLTNSRWNDPEWLDNSFQTYLRLAAGTPPESLEAKFPEFIRTYVGPRIELMTGTSYDEALQSGFRYDWKLERLADIYLYSKAQDQLAPTGDARYLTILAVIGLFILLIACINFMNLSTARATGRAREVGIRKTLGSDRGQLVRQFLGESTTLSLIAMIGAVLLIVAVLPVFAGMTGAELTPGPGLALLVLGVSLSTGLLAGLYPAFVLSGFRPALVLKGSFASSRKGTWLRSSLVVFQFAISVALLVGTTVVYKQLQFIQNRDLGFDIEQVVVLPIETSRALDDFDTFRSRALAQPGVVSVASAGILPGPNRIHNNTGFRKDGGAEGDIFLAGLGEVSADYQETLGLRVIAGRDFSDAFGTDSAAAFINRSTAQAMGFTPEEAVGKKLYRLGGMPDGSDRAMEIIGVWEDANFESLHSGVRPIVLGNWSQYQRYLPVRVRKETLNTTLKDLEDIWTAWEPGYPFRYWFMDTDYQQFYAQEQRLGSLYTMFTVLAVMIACLGLFGLASFVTVLRRKEIGVRKVMGASVPGIVALLSREFTVLVLVSCAIGMPVAWYAMHQWLQGFAYATEIGVGVFLFAGSVALLIAWLTVSWQSIRAAVTDPVKSLRYE